MADQAKDQAMVADKPKDQPELSTADLARATNPAEATPAKAPAAKTEGNGTQPAPLLPSDQADKYRTQWSNIQTEFVDEPRKSVEQADNLVAELMKDLATSFATERTNLENQWNSGNNVSTEDLRQALRRYRSFFDRLLSV